VKDLSLEEDVNKVKRNKKRQKAGSEEDDFYKKKLYELDNKIKRRKIFANMDGNIKYDIPNSIIAIKTFSDNKVNCLIDWKPRYDGSKPKRSYVPSEFFKRNNPQMLINYYEAKLTISRLSNLPN
jgi:Chromo shadow domain